MRFRLYLTLASALLALTSDKPSHSALPAPEIQAPCGEPSALEFDDCNTYFPQFWEDLVKSYHVRWRDAIRVGNDPDQPERALRACNPFAENLRLTEGGGAPAFNSAPDPLDSGASGCGSWGRVLSRERRNESQGQGQGQGQDPPPPPELEWSIDMSNSQAEGALWNGITHVHFVAQALKIVLDEVRASQGFSFQYAMREATSPIAEYKILLRKAKELTPSSDGSQCSEESGPQNGQRECYRKGVKESLKLLFLRLAQARVAEITHHLTLGLQSRFPSLASSCSDNGNRLRYPCNQTSEGNPPGDTVGAFFIREVIKTPGNECAAGNEGATCRQNRYQTLFAEWIKGASRGDSP